MPDSWASPAVVIMSLGIFLSLGTTAPFRFFAARPFALLIAGLALGSGLSFAGVNVLDSTALPLLAEAGLAILVYSATLQIRIQHLRQHCPASIPLAAWSGMLFLILCTLTLYILQPGLTILGALTAGIVLMLNGSGSSSEKIESAPLPGEVKCLLRHDSALLLLCGIPVAAMTETAGLAGQVPLDGAWYTVFLDSGLFSAAIGFAVGGAVGLLSARFLSGKWSVPVYIATFVTVVIAWCLASLAGGHAILAVMAAGLVRHEELPSLANAHRETGEMLEKTVQPAALFLFGIAAAGLLINTGLLIVLFALSTVTLMKFISRVTALRLTRFDPQHHFFIASHGGAPGAASALYLLCLSNHPAIADHESLMTACMAAVIAGIVISRLTRHNLAEWYIRHAAASRIRVPVT